MHSIDATPGQRAGRDQVLPQVALEITRGRAKHKRRDVRSQAFLIGSAPDNDLVLGDPRFDELHSYVYLTPRKVTIRRLGGSPPLCVGGQAVSVATLADSDRVQMGPYEFQVRINWRDAQRGERVPAQALAGHTQVSIENDPALERLLCDIERLSAAPPMRLFVGERGSTVSVKSSPMSGAPPQAFSRRASY
jgi:pSer/pThr/pTyr-binding forkhead associated (FHA) protein